MDSLRKWFYRPKRDDKSLLAQFFFADEALNIIAGELDSFDGRKDPERCSALVNQLRQSQDKVLTITNCIMDDLIGDERANRDFRVKFPEDVLQENLAGQLWFGAECLAAGSSIMNREVESESMRPLAKALTKSLENVRNLLRETCLRCNQPNGPLKLNTNEVVTELLLESLKIFDRLFAEFELCYVSAMVPVKSTQEYELQQLIGVLFSETLQRALKMGLLTQEMVDDCDPALMFTIPRLAIVSGLLVFPNGPLSIDKPVEEMSEMFRPFRTLLRKIRELLWTFTRRELFVLEKILCDNETSADFKVADCNASDEFLMANYGNLCKSFVPDCSVKLKKKDSKEYQRNRDYDHFQSEKSKPSTSGYLISNTVDHDKIVAAISSQSDLEQDQQLKVESLPDDDSLEIITEAAATLNSILTITDTTKPSKKTKITCAKLHLESPDDSGICTENTSLDRSPTFDSNDANACCSCVLPSKVCNKSKKRVNNNNSNSFNNGNVSRTCSKNVPGTSKTQKCGCFNKGYRENCRISEDDSSSVVSSDSTSSFNSNSADDEEIAMAVQAAEIATRNEVRSKFRSSEDLIHRLYVCIAGVADQLQTNFASDLRNILKSVFLMNVSNDPDPSRQTDSIEYHPTDNEVIENEEFSVDPDILAQEALFDTVYFQINDDGSYDGNALTDQTVEDVGRSAVVEGIIENGERSVDGRNVVPVEAGVGPERPPIWIPDVEAPKCMSCGSNFTVVKRRHHCRNCGKVFCSRCSSNNVPLPKFGHTKPVRVCNKCFLYHLAPFTM
ncbi:lateral signaling target protein 2 homolog [Onthophagus taurus]|uniref:lateral signaling target protein 2 homolog n=1 Tax=Onthophagus taurus TaxID=166361 RepID=UPI000C20EF8D|nr:lateral signaling target protein 2 homolog [Onthophagus taurus]